RLVPRFGQVDDREPSESQARFALAPGPLVVGPAMLEAVDRFGEAHLAARRQHRAGDPAHQAPPLKSDSSLAAFAAQVNSARARAGALSPLARRGSASEASIAARHAATEPGVRRCPVSPSTTISGKPPLSEASTGSPHAIASTTLMPKASSPIEG